MKLIADLHTHTCASTHAFSTLQEMIAAARGQGYRAMAITDHGVKMPDAPHEWYFSGLSRLPGCIDGDFLLLKGVEANIVDANGSLDMSPKQLDKLDWIIASIHRSIIPGLSYDEATRVWLAIAHNPQVDMIGHSEEERFAYDYEQVTRVFAQTGKVVEMNASSKTSRPGNEENLRRLALACKQNNTFIAVTSDAHSAFELGNKADVLNMLKEIDFPEELVVNASLERLLAVLEQHGRPAGAKAKAWLL